MENKKQGYMKTLMVEMRKEKTRIHVFNNTPFPKNLSVKEMFEKKFHALFILTKVHCTNRSSCSVYSGEKLKMVLLFKPKYSLASLLIKIIQE